MCATIGGRSAAKIGGNGDVAVAQVGLDEFNSFPNDRVYVDQPQFGAAWSVEGAHTTDDARDPPQFDLRNL